MLHDVLLNCQRSIDNLGITILLKVKGVIDSQDRWRFLFVMNLYKIIFQHFAPKGSQKGIKCFVMANSDDEVYEFIKSNEEKCGYNDWDEKEIDEDFVAEFKDVYGDEFENFKQRIIHLKGEINDDEIELNDLYYGKTLLGWQLIKENVDSTFISSLLGEESCFYQAHAK